MAADFDNYWLRVTQRRFSRRRVMQAAALAGAGFAGATLIACKSSPSHTASPSNSPTSGASAGSGVNALVGRTGANPAGEKPVLGGTLNWWIGANPPTFDPTQNVSINTTYLATAVMSRPFRFKTYWDVASSNNLDIEPDLASSAESPDGVTWTMKLRPEPKFQDVPPVSGRPVDSEDLKATFTKATNPKSVNAGNLSMIDPAQIQTPDKQTVVFKLKYPYAPFQTLMASGFYSWVFPREAVAGDYDPGTKIIGSGPFLFDSYTPDVAVNFKKNPSWYEKGRPYIDGVKLAIIPDPGTRSAQFTAGHLDYLFGLLQDDVPSLQQENPKAELIKTVGNGNGVMYYDLRDSTSMFQDIRVRQALSLAMDRDAYAKGSGFGNQYLQTFSVPPNVGKWAAMAGDYPADTLQWYKYNLPQAKQLMEAAGGSKLSIKMIYPAGNPADPLLGRQAEIARNMLSALPWNLVYATVDYSKDWINGGKGYGYPGGGMTPQVMAWWGWSVRSSVDEYLYSFWDSKGAGNFMHVSDPQLDAGIEKARSTLDENERITVYKDVQRYIASKVYVLMGLENGLGFTMLSPRSRNYLLGDASGWGTGYWSKMWLTA